MKLGSQTPFLRLAPEGASPVDQAAAWTNWARFLLPSLPAQRPAWQACAEDRPGRGPFWPSQQSEDGLALEVLHIQLRKSHRLSKDRGKRLAEPHSAKWKEPTLWRETHCPQRGKGDSHWSRGLLASSGSPFQGVCKESHVFAPPTSIAKSREVRQTPGFIRIHF